jgi:hypothetical protein
MRKTVENTPSAAEVQAVIVEAFAEYGVTVEVTLEQAAAALAKAEAMDMADTRLDVVLTSYPELEGLMRTAGTW